MKNSFARRIVTKSVSKDSKINCDYLCIKQHKLDLTQNNV